MQRIQIPVMISILCLIGALLTAQNGEGTEGQTSGWEKKIRNTAMHPPGVPCEIQEKSIDRFTGKSKVILKPVPFFSKTPDELKGRLNDRPFIDGKVALARIDNTLYLVLEIGIATKKTEDLFGELPEKGLVKIKLLSGETVTVVAAQSTKDIPDPEKNHTVFTGYYPITSSKKEALAGSEVDMIRVVWGTGYEDYQIYYMDAVGELLACMENKGI